MIKRIRDFWPFVTKVRYEATRRENWELRGAIRAANEELVSHRRLLAGLRTGQTDVILAVEKALSK